jgi:threonine dehydratase
MSERHGCEVFVKYENQGPIRSFKARGALNALATIPDGRQRRGVVTASTGNHGQGVAFAGTALGIPTTVVVPHGTAAVRLEAIRRFGGTVSIDGADLAEGQGIAERMASAEGALFLEDGNDGALMAGAAAIAWEALEDEPDLDVLLVPVGGGNLIAGVALVAKHVNPKVEIVGIQSESAPAATRSWREGRVVAAACETFAEGLATSWPGELAFQTYQGLVDDMVLVREDELLEGLVEALAVTGQAAEGAAAAPFAALRRYGERWRGKKVGLIFTGGNLDLACLRLALERSDRQEAAGA